VRAGNGLCMRDRGLRIRMRNSNRYCSGGRDVHGKTFGKTFGTKCLDWNSNRYCPRGRRRVWEDFGGKVLRSEEDQ
jgi:hypothetical protein